MVSRLEIDRLAEDIARYCARGDYERLMTLFTGFLRRTNQMRFKKIHSLCIVFVCLLVNTGTEK